MPKPATPIRRVASLALGLLLSLALVVGCSTSDEPDTDIPGYATF